ncbi:hypothetical protein GPECTOR_86g374 [Gonium pectorale]|uniref:Lactate/malate dehydrogenase C-terminal domain-containing protein n=1 Tax=Gonium pectorale TaxID=33097 RepID=A0A150G193_GONPE|nr:hypothetical protein GPECTOR_86g374 [Gonium pectorale]|eukprot:KXZ43581.1 hypothetical protein GPECTOR_86g374 [Gonium pectorale]
MRFETMPLLGAYPDVNHGSAGGKPIRAAVGDDAWLDGELITTVQQRGAAVIKARLPCANAVCNHVRDWLRGTPAGAWTSMGVVSEGAYGVQPGLVYSYPVTCAGGQWKVVEGLPIDEASRSRMLTMEAELKEERDLALQCLAERKE